MNNDFFLVEMIGISAVVTGLLVARAVRRPDDAVGWKRFRPALVAAGLTLLLVPWAVLLAVVAYVIG